MKYRYKVIASNLTKSFPDKSIVELEEIIRGAYRNFCDILLEGIKGMTMSEAAIAKRYQVQNPEFLQPYFDANQDVLLAASHYANWEWGISLGLQFPHFVMVTYKPVKNPHINTFIEASRAFDNLDTVQMKKTYEYLNRKPTKPRLLILIADQSPSNAHKAHWGTFLGQETAFLPGPDTIARQYKMPLLYADVQRASRGIYHITLSLLNEKPQQTTVGQLTQSYVQALEKIITKKPENWLWTHRRWKKEKPEEAIEFKT